MAIYSIFKDFVGKIPIRGRMVAFDWGARRIGVAVSDETRGFSFPLAVFANGAAAQNKIAEIIENNKAVGVIIGLPSFGDGTDSETTKRVRKFANDLSRDIKLPITFIDEALSSVAAEELMKSAPKSEQAKGLDAFAAAIILEDAITKMQRINKEK